MNFRIMFLISKEKYEALNKRVSSREVTVHNYIPTKSPSSISIPNSSSTPTQEILNQNPNNIKQNPATSVKSIACVGVEELLGIEEDDDN